MGQTLRPDTLARNDERMMSAIPYIIDWVRDGWAEVDVDLLARNANTAPHYFRRIFRDATGDPVLRFVRRLRLAVAAYRLVFTDQSVIDIGLRAGYGSAAAFSRAFREQYANTPTDVRARQLDEPWPASGPCCAGNWAATRNRRTMAFLRHFGGFDSLSTMWQRLDHLTAPRPGPPPQPAVVCYDDPEKYLGEPMRCDVGYFIDDRGASNNGVGLVDISSGRYRYTRHVGPIEFAAFSYMHIAVAAAMDGRLSRHTPRGFEFYLTYESDDSERTGTTLVGLLADDPEPPAAPTTRAAVSDLPELAGWTGYPIPVTGAASLRGSGA